MTFSDDSDMEDPEAGLISTATRKTSCAQKALPRKSTRSQASSLVFGGQSSSAQTRRGRPGGRRAVAAEEKRERANRRAPGKRAEEERDLLRAVEEQEKVEEELEISFEVLRVSEEEEEAPGELGYPRDWEGSCLHAPLSSCIGLSPPLPPIPGTRHLCLFPAGRRRLPRRRQEGADGEHEVLQRKAGEDVLAARWPGGRDPLHLEGTLSSTLPTAGGEHPARCGWGGFGAGELWGEES